MTPRSKRYLERKAWQSVYKHVQSIVQCYLEATKPIPKYPPGTSHPGGIAIVGEPGPELIFGPRKLVSLPPGTRIFPEIPIGEFRNNTSVVSQGLIDVTIKNAFTPLAEMTIKKVQP